MTKKLNDKKAQCQKSSMSKKLNDKKAQLKVSEAKLRQCSVYFDVFI